MSADILLQHLEKVKRTGQGKWLACCPSHADKTASLSVRETDEGKILIHCFAQCSVEEVLGAVGLEMSDLFPPRTDQHFVKGERRPFPAADVLRAIAGETAFLYLCAKQLTTGQPLCESDQARLLLACSRVADAARAAGVTV